MVCIWISHGIGGNSTQNLVLHFFTCGLNCKNGDFSGIFTIFMGGDTKL
jgi:Mlc titration factor MtfA (ptsG expression regulator)